MTYTENILAEARKIIADKNINATINMNGLSAYLIIDGNRIDFVTPKLAKIYVQNYAVSDIVKVEAAVPAVIASGVVSRKNDETPKKRRGRPKKADNDRTRRI
jgi:hypothetical protein